MSDKIFSVIFKKNCTIYVKDFSLEPLKLNQYLHQIASGSLPEN